jgi:hypothetical protein
MRFAAVAAFALTGAGMAADVFKWTDRAGATHYGDRPPPGVRAADDPRTDDERADARRLAEARAVQAASAVPAAPVAAPAAMPAPPSAVTTADADCRRQRELFLEGQRFRTVRRADGSTTLAPVATGRPVLAPNCDGAPP